MAIQGHHGVGTWTQKPDYKAYKSPYGPNYKVQPNFHGISPGRALKLPADDAMAWADLNFHSGITAGSFSLVGATMLLYFFSEVPKVRTDIMQKIPLVGDYYIKEIPPEDNVSLSPCSEVQKELANEA
ncbi:MAG: hypothetical protein Q9201_004224 [Fulgogasparrea decipioides]